MRYSRDPKLLEIAKDALLLVWPELDNERNLLQNSILYKDGYEKLPKHVKNPPSAASLRGYGTYFVHLYLGKKQRTVAYCGDPLSAARLADAILVWLDPYRKTELETNAESAAGFLNFEYRFAKLDIDTVPHLSEWLIRLTEHLSDSDYIRPAAERDVKSVLGRPQNAAVLTRIEDGAKNLREQFDIMQKQLDRIEKLLTESRSGAAVSAIGVLNPGQANADGAR